jgi:uncharacterized SAM-binding protein YcdF (DUF218 family)
MNASVLFNTAASAMLLPPLNLVLLCLVGLVVQRTRPRLGLAIVLVALALLVVLSTNAGARLLVEPLERSLVPQEYIDPAGAEAIVVLGGGRIERAAEYGAGDIPDFVALARVRYAAYLQRQTGLPVLLSGGTPDGSAESEAALMARVLTEDYGVPVRWIEGRSVNTAQNAQFSAAALMSVGVRRILLVTDGIHMARSQRSFERVGFEVVAAPTALLSRGELRPIDFFPSGEGLRRSHYALHEWIGIVWYRFRYG